MQIFSCNNIFTFIYAEHICELEQQKIRNGGKHEWYIIPCENKYLIITSYVLKVSQ